MSSPSTQTKKFSARNEWRGRIVKLRIDGVMAEVVLDCQGHQVVSVITRDSAEQLGLVEGAQAVAWVKATDVLMGLRDA